MSITWGLEPLFAIFVVLTGGVAFWRSGFESRWTGSVKALILSKCGNPNPSLSGFLLAVSKITFRIGSNTPPILCESRRYHSQGVIKFCLIIRNELMDARKKLMETIWRMFMKSTCSFLIIKRNTAIMSIKTIIYSKPTASIALRPTEPIYAHERSSKNANETTRITSLPSIAWQFLVL